MQSVPDDVVYEFLLRIPFPDILDYCRTNAQAARVCQTSNVLWLNLFERDWPVEMLDYCTGTYKDCYLETSFWWTKLQQDYPQAIPSQPYGTYKEYYLAAQKRIPTNPREALFLLSRISNSRQDPTGYTYTLQELKQLCQWLGLAIQGNKAQLAETLRNAILRLNGLM